MARPPKYSRENFEKEFAQFVSPWEKKLDMLDILRALGKYGYHTKFATYSAVILGQEVIEEYERCYQPPCVAAEPVKVKTRKKRTKKV